MIIKNYWRLATTALPTSYSPFDNDLLSGPPELLRRIRPGEGVVLSTWNEAGLIGHAIALGVFLSRTDQGVRIDWREVDITLKPNPSGRTHWRAKPFFGFADSVIVRYGLGDLFAERFPDLDSFAFESRKPNPNVSRRLPTIVTPGYVYLIKSQYGYKIGKTINIKSRTRIFEVKLPFPITVEHYAHFDNYSEAERSLHDRFSAKRLEGEWFDLRAEDVAYIKTLGKPASATEIRIL